MTFNLNGKMEEVNWPSGGNLFQTDAALIYDAVYVFAHALEQVEPSYSRMRLVNLSCDGEQAWAFGSSLYSYLNLVCIIQQYIDSLSATLGVRGQH